MLLSLSVFKLGKGGAQGLGFCSLAGASTLQFGDVGSQSLDLVEPCLKLELELEH